MIPLQLIVPPGCPKVSEPPDDEIYALCCQLADVGKTSVSVPGTDLFIEFIPLLDGAAIEFSKDGELAILNCCCFEYRHFETVIFGVSKFYAKYDLGEPKYPAMPMWIHCIPIPGLSLEEAEILLAQKMAMVFFFMYLGQKLRRGNDLN